MANILSVGSRKELVSGRILAHNKDRSVNLESNSNYYLSVVASRILGLSYALIIISILYEELSYLVNFNNNKTIS